MRKFWLLIVLIIAAVATIFFLRVGKIVESTVKPEVLNVTTSQVTIAWTSKEKYKGRVSYMPAGTEVPAMIAAETFGASDQHEVVLTGLRASTRYTYWIGNSKSRFQFQTQPAQNSPFSFVAVWGDVSDRIVPLMRSESGEFIVSLTSATDQKNDWFSDVRPYVPVYNLLGIDSPFLKATGDKHQSVPNNLWKLDWGGLRLIFVGRVAEPEKIAEMFSSPSAHTIGIITSAEVIGAMESKKDAQIDDSLGQTTLHSIIVSHNKQHPTRAAAFAAIIGNSEKNIEIDGVQYFGISTANKGNRSSGAIRVDVDVESSRAVFVDENREVALKQPPLKQKRTCEECRRLADKGAYEESVKAYLEFIETHKGNFQIDDAYFAIAEIFDSKLFEFENALAWYRRLATEYPDGTLTSLASQRIKYISAYADYDYKPLANFERIKAVKYARKKDQPQERDKIFGEVKSLIKAYPDSNLAPVMQHWLANQYRLSEPDKAVEAYMTLRKNYRSHSESQEAMVEIGETYYDAGRYKEAIKAFNEALGEMPGLADTIKSQIARSERNLRRDKIAYVCWGIAAIVFGAAFIRKPRRIGARSIVCACAAFVIVGAVLSFYGWLIHEQFNSAREMVLIVSSFSAIAGLSALISMKFTRKVNADSTGIFSAVVGGLAGVVFFLAGIYLAIYHIYIHYLIVVKL
jgi:tetratricopeptide (TPR) repeat protein